MSLARKGSKAGSKTGLARKQSKMTSGSKAKLAKKSPQVAPAPGGGDEHDEGNVVVQDFHVEVSRFIIIHLFS